MFNRQGIQRLLEEEYSGARSHGSLLCLLATFALGLPDKVVTDLKAIVPEGGTVECAGCGKPVALHSNVGGGSRQGADRHRSARASHQGTRPAPPGLPVPPPRDGAEEPDPRPPRLHRPPGHGGEAHVRGAGAQGVREAAGGAVAVSA